MDLISIIIPSYNSAEFISQALDSCFDQSWSIIEVIVVNDGSTDNLDEVIKPYEDRIRYIKQENKGLSEARNAGFRASQGNYVCFLDADDTLLPDKFERQMAVFKRQPDLGVVISGYLEIDADGTTVIGRVEKHWHRDALNHLLDHEVFPVHAALIKRDVLPSDNPFPDMPRGEYQEDWQLWLDLALNDVAFSSIPDATCRYWRRSGSGSSFPLKHLDGARRVVSWLRQHPRAEPYRERIERLAAIVEMERVARARQVGETQLMRQSLAEAIEQSPDFWLEPFTYVRLLERTLTIQEAQTWITTRDIGLLKHYILDQILLPCQDEIPGAQYSRMMAAAWLTISDEGYAKNNSQVRQSAVKNALRQSPKQCFSFLGYRYFIRGIIGPRPIGIANSLLGRQRKS